MHNNDNNNKNKLVGYNRKEIKLVFNTNCNVMLIVKDYFKPFLVLYYFNHFL